jgi:hypothetical protein
VLQPGINASTRTGKPSTLRKVTRVYNQELRLTANKEEQLRSLDAALWAHVLCRGLVADYHTRCVETFGGAASNRLDEEGTPMCYDRITAVDGNFSCWSAHAGRNELATLKAATVATIDAFTKAVAEQWPINPYTRCVTQ